MHHKCHVMVALLATIIFISSQHAVEGRNYPGRPSRPVSIPYEPSPAPSQAEYREQLAFVDWMQAYNKSYHHDHFRARYIIWRYTRLAFIKNEETHNANKQPQAKQPVDQLLEQGKPQRLLYCCHEPMGRSLLGRIWQAQSHFMRT